MSELLNPKINLFGENEDINIINKKQIKILLSMNDKLNLSILTLIIEMELGPQFYIKELKNVLYKCYNKNLELCKSQIDFLINNISLEHLKIKENTSKIQLSDLFNIFSDILNIKITSPLLTIYNLINNDFYQNFQKIVNNYDIEQNINIIDLNKIINDNDIYIDSIDLMIIFRCLDYDKKGVIKLKDLLTLLESYEKENLKGDKINHVFENEYERFILILNKNEINIYKHIFEEEERKISINEIIFKIKQKILIKSRYEKNITQSICTNFFNTIFSNPDFDTKINFQDLNNYLLNYQNKKENKLNNNNFFIKEPKLSNFQIQYISKYINFLVEKGKTINDIIKNEEARTIYLKDIKKYITRLNKNNLSKDEIEYIIESLNIYDKNHILKNDYLIIMKYVEAKHSIKKETNHIHNESLISTYFKLPVKGNKSVIKKLIKEIVRSMNLYKISKNYKILNNNHFSNRNSFNGNSKLLNILEFNEYQNEIIKSLENINFENPIISCYDIITVLKKCYSKNASFQIDYNKKNFKRLTSNIINLLDKDNDGFVYVIDIINFLLTYFQYKSTILTYKYIKIKIQVETKNNIKKFFTKNYGKLRKIILYEELINFLKINFQIPETIARKIYQNLNNNYPYPIKIKNLVEVIDMVGMSQNKKYFIAEKTNENIGNGYSSNNNELINLFENHLKKNLNNADILNVTKFEESIGEISDNLIKIGNKAREKFNENYYENILVDNLKFLLHINKEDEYDEEIKYDIKNYVIKFLKPMNISIDLGVNIFLLLKIKENNTFYIKFNDIKYLLLAYINSQEIKKPFQLIINKIKLIEPNFIDLLEKINFSQIGDITTYEIFKVIKNNYTNILREHDIKQLISLIDTSFKGYMTYKELQLFFNINFPIDNNFSYIFEIKHILSFLINNNFICLKDGNKNNVSYFLNEYFIKELSKIGGNKKLIDFSKITKNIHFRLFKKITTSGYNNKKLYEYMLNNQGNKKYYNLHFLLNDLNYFLSEIFIENLNNENINNEIDNILPSIEIIREILKKNKIMLYMEANNFLDDDEQFSILEFISPLKNSIAKKNLAKALDVNRNGTVSILEMKKILKKLYYKDNIDKLFDE